MCWRSPCRLYRPIPGRYLPRWHQNLFAVVRGENAFDGLIDDITTGKTPDREKIVTSLLPFTLSSTPKNRTASTVYIVEYSCAERGMIGVLYRNRERVLRTVQEYLRWYLTEKIQPDGTVTHCGTELLFGGKTIPSVLAPKALLEALDQLMGIPETVTPQMPVPVDGIFQCLFVLRQKSFGDAAV